MTRPLWAERYLGVVVTSTNPRLGQQVHEHLLKLNIETPMRERGKSSHAYEEDTYSIQSAFGSIMNSLRLDDRDDSLKDTPKRVAKMYMDELFCGLDYGAFPEATAFENKAQYDEMIYTRSTVYSTCEHHFLPFIGIAHIAYIPGEKFLGLSKFSRITDFFSRRPQVQERLAVQIQEALKFILQSDDVAVLIKAEHYCGKIRGVQEHNGTMITSKLGGRFMTVSDLRAEFMASTRL